MDWDEGERLYLYGEEHNWRSEHVFDKMDGCTPHVTPVLSDAAPMLEDKLSIAELLCILLCTVGRLRRKEYRSHRIIPVRVSLISLFSSLSLPISLSFSSLSMRPPDFYY